MTTRRSMPQRRQRTAGTKTALLCASMLTALGLSACGGDGGKDAHANPDPVALGCDDSIKTGFKPDADTTVLLVKAFKKGEALLLSGTATAQTPVAGNDLCMVKLNVGPGNPGPADAPSTSQGIGIEIWLPSVEHWNNRIHALGSGGWLGGQHTSLTQVASSAAAAVAGEEGAVSSTTDSGHIRADGSFAMHADGTVNQKGWADFSRNGVDEQALKTKALVAAYYGRAARYAYFHGGSGGGRQALMLAQEFPQHYDGILGILPAINWTRFITAELYPQIVFQRDLNGVALTKGQQDLVSNAAIHACDVVGGQHLGFIPDPSACTYDPTTDPQVLCVADGGVNASGDCVSTTQAVAINKIWYGMTADGSVPAPAVDNGWQTSLSGKQRWYGLSRGTSLYGSFLASLGVDGLTSPNGPFTIASDMVALALQDPTLAAPNFLNATGNGQSKWKHLSYAQLDNAFDRGEALQETFSRINANNPDLQAFKARGGKFLSFHGLADELIPAQGTIHYYHRVADAMGGLASVQEFFKLYLVPGYGHGTPNGTSNPSANPPVVPESMMYEQLTRWVEDRVDPGRIDLSTPTTGAPAMSWPICVYPRKASHVSGSPLSAASYTCS